MVNVSTLGLIHALLGMRVCGAQVSFVAVTQRSRSDIWIVPGAIPVKPQRGLPERDSHILELLT